MDIECISGCEEGTMKREQASFLKAFARFVYGKEYGAIVACVVVASALYALQVANSLLGDLVPWPKEVHVGLMFAAVVNIGVAAIVSLCRRKWGTAVAQFMCCFVAWVGCGLVAFFVVCTPTRMAFAPGGEWVEHKICSQVGARQDKLIFLGGISQREPVAVFEVADGAVDESRFATCSPWADETGARAVAHYRNLMKASRIDVALPDDASISNRDVEYGMVSLVKANGRAYLVYEGM